MRQTSHDFELIVSDNSTDESVDAMVRSEYPAIKYRRRARHLQVFEHLNVCLTEAEAPYVCLFHDDDVLDASYVDKTLEAVRRHPEAVAIATNAWLLEQGVTRKTSFQTGRSVEWVRGPREMAERYFSRHQRGIAPFPSYIYSTDRLAGMRFTVDGGKYSDMAWLIRVAERGPVLWLGEPLMTYRIHADNFGKQESIRDRLKVLAFLKERRTTLGGGIISDFRHFLYKRILQLASEGLMSISAPRDRLLRAYITNYRVARLVRMDHHRSLLVKSALRLWARIRLLANRTLQGVG